jgi:hypothetical protein
MLRRPVQVAVSDGSRLAAYHAAQGSNGSRRVSAAPGNCRPAMSCAGRLRCAIRVDRVGNEDASAEQAENGGESLNHFDAPLLYYWERLIPGLCFMAVSLGWHNGFTAA